MSARELPIGQLAGLKTFCLTCSPFFEDRYVNETRDNTNPTTRRQPYGVYLGILGAVVIARWIQIAAQQVGSAEILLPWMSLLVSLSLACSVAFAIWCRYRLQPILTLLMCGLIGAIPTMIVDPLPGAVVGFAVGGIRLVEVAILKWHRTGDTRWFALLTALRTLRVFTGTVLLPAIGVALLASQASVTFGFGCTS